LTAGFPHHSSNYFNAASHDPTCLNGQKHDIRTGQKVVWIDHSISIYTIALTPPPRVNIFEERKYRQMSFEGKNMRRKRKEETVTEIARRRKMKRKLKLNG
jgi:hypothetical protein